MKKQWIRLLSLIMALILALPTMGSVTALAEGEEYFPEDGILDMPDEALSLGEEETEGATAMVSSGTVEGEAEEGSSGPNNSGELSLGADDFYEDALASDVRENNTLSAGGLTNAKLTASHSSISINKGSTSTVTFSVSNFYGFFYLEVLTSNQTAYSCEWGAWSNTSKIPLRITAKKAGSGRIVVRLRAPNDSKIYATREVRIDIPQTETGSIKLNASSQTISVDKSFALKVTVNSCNVDYYLRYSNSNSAAAKLTWGNWSGQTVPLTVKGLKAGKGTVTIQLRSVSTDKVMDSKTFNYTIEKKENPQIVLSPTSVTINAGKTQKVTVTAKGYSGYFYFAYSTPSTSAYSLSWGTRSGNTNTLTVTGKNKGSGTVPVGMYNSSGTKLASKSFTVTVNAVQQPKVTVSSSSVSLNKGATKSVTCSYSGTSETIYLRYSTTNTSAYSLSWGSWNNSKVPLNITGKAAGSGYVTIYLKRKSNDATLASVQIYVSVSAVTNTLTFSKVAYKHQNYSALIPLSTCQLMFGNTQAAKNVYYENMGNGGNCYGFATSAGILAVNNGLNPSSFRSGATNVSQLSSSDYNSSLKITIKQFLEGMHVAQLSSSAVNHICHNSLSSLVSTVKSETNAGRPVAVGVRGAGSNGKVGGHRLLAFGYSESSTAFNIRIYDSNWPNQERTLTIKKSGNSYTSWSYPFTNSITWGTGKTGANMYYTTYSEYKNLWDKRGSLRDYGCNMICTSAGDFSLYNFNNQLVAKYENGALVQNASNVTEAFLDDALPDGTIADHPHILYVPVDYYTVKNDTQGSELSITISADMLSTKVTTNAETFGFCADDNDDVANATLKPLENMEFSIMIGSSKPGDPAETKLEGLGTGEPISMEFKNSNLSLSGEGLAVITRTEQATEYFISATASEGGTITPEGINSYEEGSSATFQIIPDSGYAVRAVYVDGVNVGSMQEYTFDSIGAAHSIEAEFAADIAQCEVNLSQTAVPYTGAELTPPVTVISPDGAILKLNDDYEVYYEDNIEPGTATVYVSGAMGSAWFGTKQLTFTVSNLQTAIASVTYTPANSTVEVGLLHTSAVKLITMLYGTDGSMKAVKLQAVPANQNTVSVSFAGQTVANGDRFGIFMVDDQFKPLCASYKYTAE